MPFQLSTDHKKFNITKEDTTIYVKTKHIPIYLMMLHNHFNPFSSKEKYANHEVIKSSSSDTIVVKIGGKISKYAIGNFDNGTRLYGKDLDDYLIVNEEEVNKLILLLSDYYLDIMGVTGILKK